MYAESNGYVSWQLEKLLFSQAKGFCLGGGVTFDFQCTENYWKYFIRTKINISQSTLTIHATSLPPPPPSLPKKEKKI